MSNQINYNELDQAVNAAARRNRAVSSVWPQKATSAKPTPKTAIKAPVQPIQRRRVMDFTPVKQASAQPIASRPVVKRVMQAERPSAQPKQPSVAAQIQQKQARVAAQAKTKPAAASKTKAAAPKPTPAKKVTESKKPTAPKPKAPKEAPDANNYSLGGRSPFFINTNVEKRPLGTDIPETNLHKLRSTRNVYSHKLPTDDKHQAARHIITAAPQKRSGWLWVLAVLGIIAAGGGLGYLAYLLVFAN